MGGGEGAATAVQDGEVMMFLLPSKYNESNEPPKPDNDQVSLKKIGERILAVKTFSGAVDYEGETVKKEKENLFAALERDHLLPAGETIEKVPFQLARYNPPWTIGPLRKNEVFFTLVGAGDDASEFNTRLAKLMGDHTEEVDASAAGTSSG